MRKICLAFLLLTLLSFEDGKKINPTQTVQAEPELINEIIKGIDWPDDYSNQPLEIHMVGGLKIVGSGYQKMYRYFTNKMHNQRPIKVLWSNRNTALRKAGSIVFILERSRMSKKLNEYKDKLNKNHNLIIADNEKAVEKGAHIVFLESNGKLMFKIHSSNLNSSGLTAFKHLKNSKNHVNRTLTQQPTVKVEDPPQNEPSPVQEDTTSTPPRARVSIRSITPQITNNELATKLRDENGLLRLEMQYDQNYIYNCGLPKIWTK